MQQNQEMFQKKKRKEMSFSLSNKNPLLPLISNRTVFAIKFSIKFELQTLTLVFAYLLIRALFI